MRYGVRGFQFRSDFTSFSSFCHTIGLSRFTEFIWINAIDAEF